MPGFVLLVRPRGDDDPVIRLGITVTKKIGNAVIRNRMKRRFRALALAAGIPLAASETPIQPILLGAADHAVQASNALLGRGFYAAAIRPPSVPAGASRLRITISAAHRDVDIEALVAALAEIQVPR